jgi:hypothetical protein
MSGLSFRDMIVFALSAVSVVSTRAFSSSSELDQPSSKFSVSCRSNRPDAFDRDERPRAKA